MDKNISELNIKLISQFLSGQTKSNPKHQAECVNSSFSLDELDDNEIRSCMSEYEDIREMLSALDTVLENAISKGEELLEVPQQEEE